MDQNLEEVRQKHEELAQASLDRKVEEATRLLAAHYNSNVEALLKICEQTPNLLSEKAAGRE